MLTEQERKWLTVRKKACARCGKVPFRCSQDQRNACYRAGFPLWDKTTVTFESYRDAAEFEARVAARLAGAWAIGEDMCFNNHCQLFAKDRCTACYLKNARIAVEEEMDNE